MGNNSEITRFTKVKVRNYKCLKNINVDLNDLTVLVGPNGSGKSTFIDVFRFLSDVSQYGRIGLEKALEIRGGISSLKSKSSNNNSDLSIEVEGIHRNHSFKYGFIIETLKDNDYLVKKEFASLYPEKNGRYLEACTEYLIENGKWKKHGKLSPELEPNTSLESELDKRILNLSYISDADKILRPIFRGIGFSTFPIGKLRVPQKPMQKNLALLGDISNLATLLKEILKTDRKHNLINPIKKIAPNLRGVEVDEIGGYYVIKFKHQIKNKIVAIDASHESDGTLRVLAILVSIYQSSKEGGGLRLFEEPENAIHPGVLALLCDIFKEVSLFDTQIILTTHSPDLISRFPAENILHVTNKTGSTQIKKVAKHNMEAINEELFSAGDLLRISGSL